MTFPSSSSFKDALEQARNLPVRTPEENQRIADARRSDEHTFINIERWQLEEWVYALREFASGDRQIESVADEIQGFVDQS